MASGKAHGVDREYQVTCRDVLTHRHPTLTPWSGDGIDVAFPLPDTTWTFDVALCGDPESLVVAECRRTLGPVKQEDVAAFALKAEGLRKALARPVSAIFFTKTHHQIGAVRVGQFYGVEVAILDQDANPPGFNLIFLTYDSERDRSIRHFIVHVPPGELGLTGYPVTLTHGKANGKQESR